MSLWRAPNRNANYAWIQDLVHHLAPAGRAGFVMANGSLTSNTNWEGKIRRRIIESDLVDCVVALPPQLFFTTGIPVCLWFVDRNKAPTGGRDRRGHDVTPQVSGLLYPLEHPPHRGKLARW